MCFGGSAPAPPPPPPLPPAPPPPLPPKKPVPDPAPVETDQNPSVAPAQPGGGKAGQQGPSLTVNPTVQTDPNANVNTGNTGPAGGLNI